MKHEVQIIDALNNCRTDSGASLDYCRGLVVGLVSAMMATGVSFETAIQLLRKHYPTDHTAMPMHIVFPESWCGNVYHRGVKAHSAVRIMNEDKRSHYNYCGTCCDWFEPAKVDQ